LEIFTKPQPHEEAEIPLALADGCVNIKVTARSVTFYISMKRYIKSAINNILDESTWFQMEQASHTDDPRVLAQLAKSPNLQVRYRVACNPCTSISTLATLTEDSDEYVRAGVAENDNVTEDLLRKLGNDDTRVVLEWVALNNKTPSDVLIKLTGSYRDVRKFAAMHHNAPAELLVKLADNMDTDIRVAVAENENTPIEILKKLYNDSSWEVRASAEAAYLDRTGHFIDEEL